MYYKIIVAPYMLWLHQVEISFGGEVGISYVVTFGRFGAPTPLKYLNPLQCFENLLVINFLLNIPNQLLKCGIGNNDLSFYPCGGSMFGVLLLVTSLSKKNILEFGLI
jgi:hypothetical protein